MKILGLNTGIGASVCLLEGGRIVFALEEERPTRIKGKGGLPLQSFQFLAKHYSDFLRNLDCIALADLSEQAPERWELAERYNRRFLGEVDTRNPFLRAASKIIPARIKRIIRPLPLEQPLTGFIRWIFYRENPIRCWLIMDTRIFSSRFRDCQMHSAD